MCKEILDFVLFYLENYNLLVFYYFQSVLSLCVVIHRSFSSIHFLTLELIEDGFVKIAS